MSARNGNSGGEVLISGRDSEGRGSARSHHDPKVGRHWPQASTITHFWTRCLHHKASWVDAFLSPSLSPPGHLVLLFPLSSTRSDHSLFPAPLGPISPADGPFSFIFFISSSLSTSPNPSSLQSFPMRRPGPQPVTHLSMHSNCNSGIDLCLLGFSYKLGL